MKIAEREKEREREREKERERERAVVAGTKQSIEKFSKTKENNKNTHKKKKTNGFSSLFREDPFIL